MNDYFESLYDFASKLNTLKNVIPTTINKVVSLEKESYQKIEKFITEKCEKVEENDDKIKFKVPIQEMKYFRELQKRRYEYETAYSILTKSFIVSLISQYDKYISDTIKCMLQNNKNLVSGNDKKINLDEVLQYQDINVLLNDLIEKEIDNVMRGSHIEQIDWINDKIKGDIRKDKELIKKFVELTERRNLLVHADGIVNSYYLNKCKHEKVILDKKIVIGHQLNVNQDYFSNSIDILLELSCKLTSYIIKKLHTDIIEKTKDIVMDYIYLNLEEENFAVVQKLVPYIRTLTKINKCDEMVISINYALSYYLDGKKEDSKRILSEMDFSDCSDKFVFAKLIIEENYSDAILLMDDLKKNDDIHEIDYHQWPLFTFFRTKNEFLNKYKELYNKDFILHEEINCNNQTCLEEEKKLTTGST